MRERTGVENSVSLADRLILVKLENPRAASVKTRDSGRSCGDWKRHKCRSLEDAITTERGSQGKGLIFLRSLY